MPHWRPLEFPRDGHENSPRTATEFPGLQLASGTTPFAAGQTGYLNTMTGGKEGLPIARYSLDFHENFAARTGYAVDYRQNGSLRIALTTVCLLALVAVVLARAASAESRAS